MATRTIVKFDRREFDKTLNVYRQYTKRDNATICNTKGYFICRRATVETEKSTKAKIKADLMAPSRVAPNAPLAALIVNKRLGPGKGLQGARLKEAIAALIKSRRVATLASGWIPAIKAFESLAEKRGAPRQARIEQTGREKGSAKPASEGWKPKAVFANNAGALWDTAGTAESVATPGLQKAFDAEEASMKAYIERKQLESAKRAGIKTK